LGGASGGAQLLRKQKKKNLARGLNARASNLVGMVHS